MPNGGQVLKTVKRSKESIFKYVENARDFDKRGYVQVRRAPLKQNPFDVSVFWRPVFTMQYSAFKLKNPDRWREYERRKLALSSRLRRTTPRKAAGKPRPRSA